MPPAMAFRRSALRDFSSVSLSRISSCLRFIWFKKPMAVCRGCQRRTKRDGEGACLVREGQGRDVDIQHLVFDRQRYDPLVALVRLGGFGLTRS